MDVSHCKAILTSITVILALYLLKKMINKIIKQRKIYN